MTAILDRLSTLDAPLPPALAPADRPVTCASWCTFPHPDGDDVCMSDDLGAVDALDQSGNPVVRSLTLFANSDLPLSVMVGEDMYSPAAARHLAFLLAHAADQLQPEPTDTTNVCRFCARRIVPSPDVPGDWLDVEHGTGYCTRRASHQPREVAS